MGSVIEVAAKKYVAQLKVVESLQGRHFVGLVKEDSTHARTLTYEKAALARCVDDLVDAVEGDR